MFSYSRSRSTRANLYSHIDDKAGALDGNIQVDVGILDLSKAFDKVPHTRLAFKLDYYGIRGNVLSWLQSFLMNITQQVVIDGYYFSSNAVILWGSTGFCIGPVTEYLTPSEIIYPPIKLSLCVKAHMNYGIAIA